MTDQKAEVQRLYRDLSLDDDWKSRYAQNHGEVFDQYGIQAHNRPLLERILALHIRCGDGAEGQEP